MASDKLTLAEAREVLRTGGALTLEQLEALGIRPKDIDEAWMDETMKRLFHEIRKELSQLETAMKRDDTADEANRRSANARTLASLERTLERLAQLEQRRVFNREMKVVGSDDEARAALVRRLDQRLAAMETLPASERPDK